MRKSNIVYGIALSLICFCPVSPAVSQMITPLAQAHSHNDYEQPHPLWDAYRQGFTFVEADIHLKNGVLYVAHDSATVNSPTLTKLYLAPIDSLLRSNKNIIYPGHPSTFFLMIDIKTDASATYGALVKELKSYPALLCKSASCPIKVFLSGNRPLSILHDPYRGIAIDGRPSDLGKHYTEQSMPVISDSYANWSIDSNANPDSITLVKIKRLATAVHADGKKLRLWAIPDNKETWLLLLHAGVDIINTDHLAQFQSFLSGYSRTNK